MGSMMGGGGGGGGMMSMFGGGPPQAGGIGTSDITRTPSTAYTPTSQTAPPSDDPTKRLAAQLQLANSVAGIAGQVAGASRGPGVPAMAPPMGGGGSAYQPTARSGKRPMTLRDLLASQGQ